jgi:putative transposase
MKSKGFLIERVANRILLELARMILIQGIAYEFAIDTKDKEIYTKRKDPYIIGSKAKNGTHRFVSHATLYVMFGGKRITIAFVRVRKGNTMESITKKLLEVIKNENLTIKRLYFDRGFYSVELIQYLHREKFDALLAMPIRGDKKGLKSKLLGRKSHWIYNHEAKTTKSGKVLSVRHDVAAIVTYKKGKRGKKGVCWYAYAIIGQPISLERIKDAYRGRFGIETSYRIKNQSLGWTTSPEPEIRTLYFAIALIIQNQWVCTNWFYFRECKRGRPKGKPILPFTDFLELLLEGCRDVLGRFNKVKIKYWRKGGPFD